MQKNISHASTPAQDAQIPDPPTPTVMMTRSPEERKLRREKFKRLRHIFEKDCLYPDLPSFNMKKKIMKYKCMNDEYHDWDDEKFMKIGALSNIHEMSCRGLQLGVPSTLWEWMAGSGRLSATARKNEVTHLPPLDYRWGINLGHWWHQLICLWNLLLFPVDVLFASPTCTPWGSNARQWQPEDRERQRNQ